MLFTISFTSWSLCVYIDFFQIVVYESKFSYKGKFEKKLKRPIGANLNLLFTVEQAEVATIAKIQIQAVLMPAKSLVTISFQE